MNEDVTRTWASLTAQMIAQFTVVAALLMWAGYAMYPFICVKFIGAL